VQIFKNQFRFMLYGMRPGICLRASLLTGRGLSSTQCTTVN
jgi:hypothetical protein